MASRTLLWLVLFVFCFALLLRIQGGLGDQDLMRREQGIFQMIRNTITEWYVDDVDEKELLYGAIQGMAGKLDKHTQFWTPEQYALAREENSGRFGGLGIEIARSEQKGLVVLTPIAGTPAYRAGLLPEDRIIKIDQRPTDRMSMDDARKFIRGLAGSAVHLTVLREGKPNPLEFDIVRAEIKEQSVQEPVILQAPLSLAARVPADQPKIGYVQVAQFQEDTASDLEAALNKLEAGGMQALVLDLRQNGGGLLTAAVKVCEMFLSKGVIVSLRERAVRNSPGVLRVFEAKSDAHPRLYPIAVLVDPHSASASEIVAGCFKDNKRAVLVGEKSYGKGSVQTIFPFEMGEWGQGGLKLTTAKYYLPSGVSIDGKGIEPDYSVPFKTEQLRGLLAERRKRRLLYNDPRPHGPPAKTAPTEVSLPLKEPAAGPAESTPDTKVQPSGKNEFDSGPFYDLQLEKAVEVLTRKLKDS